MSTDRRYLRVITGITVITVVAMLGLGAVAGCASGSTPPAAPVKVGAILPTADTAQRWEDVDGPMLQRFLRLNGLQPDVRNVDGNGPALATAANREIDKGAKALVVATADPGGMAAVVNVATARGVPVVDYDPHGPDSAAAYALTEDYRAVGDLQGRGVIRGVRSTKNAAVVELESASSSAALDQLVAGQDNVLRPRFDTGAYRMAGGQRLPGDPGKDTGPALEKLLAANGGKLNAVLAADDQVASAAIAVLGRHGLAGKVTVTGLGATPDALRAILRGDQFMTVYTPVETRTATAAALAGDLARGDRAGADRRASSSGGHARAVPLAPEAVTLFNIKSVFDSGVVESGDVCTGDLQLRCNQLSIS